MFLFKKSKPQIDHKTLAGLSDHHSHILPGVDDGVRTMEEALQILSMYEKWGVKELWLTPHIMEDVPNTPEELLERFSELQAAYNGSVILRLASENMIDELFEQRLLTDQFLPYGSNSDELLVETSYYDAPNNFYQILEQIKAKGYFPVLAHPERYLYMGDSEYTKLREMGVRFQLNLFSTIGLYGKQAQEKSQWLSERGYYHYKGSDLHTIRVLKEYVK